MPKPENSSHLEELHQLTKCELAALWRQLFRNDSPAQMRKDLMHRMVAHRLQEQQFGGLSAASCRHLQQLATANPGSSVTIKSPIKSGTRIIRQWKDQVHVVNVDGGKFEYRGERYESLSEIARLITGTRWSGPLFFGVRAKQPTSTEAQ
jgi:Protein of unknown function (DUF2924)